MDYGVPLSPEGAAGTLAAPLQTPAKRKTGTATLFWQFGKTGTATLFWQFEKRVAVPAFPHHELPPLFRIVVRSASRQRNQPVLRRHAERFRVVIHGKNLFSELFTFRSIH